MLSDEIKKLALEGDVDDSPATLVKYSTDASIFYVKPSVLVFPKSTQDIKKLVLFAAEEKKKGRNISLTARAAGTDMSGGPLTESIVVEFTKYFNHLLELGDNYAVVEPGMYYRDFEKQTLTKNLILPSYPSSRELCALGGMIANNCGGEKTFRYGKTERYVDSISMIMADGNEYEFSKITQGELEKKMSLENFEGRLYKELFKLINDNYDLLKKAKPDVTKNSAGYYLWNVYDKEEGTFDMTKIIVGAQGTLGFMTKAKLNLVQPKKASKLLIVFMKDISLISKLSGIILPFKPESFETYDDKTFRLAIKYWPEILGQVKSSLVKIILKTFPEFWLIMTGGIPKLVLLAECTGDTQEEVEQIANNAKQAIHKSLGSDIKIRITQSHEETQEFWVIRRESFNLLRKHVKGMRTAPFIDDFSVKVEHLPEFLPKLYEVLGHYKIIYTIAGHAGDGNFHIIPLMDLTDPASKDIIKNLSHEVFDLVLKFGGTIDSEHNDGIVRTPFLRQMYGEKIYDLFVMAKHIFDPLNIFNPGKKVGGTFEYAQNHINTQKVGTIETKKQAS
jgi:FAD/FMN-containing dehydrogenase